MFSARKEKWKLLFEHGSESFNELIRTFARLSEAPAAGNSQQPVL